jgi:hypothetical protein
MSLTGGTVVPRSQVSVGLEPALRGELATVAAGRSLVIDYFASQRCSVVIGDLTCNFRAAPPGIGYVELASIEGVRLFTEERLLAILGEAGAGLRWAGASFARHLAVDLDRPELWIDFLESPGILAGKRRFRPRIGAGDRPHAARP